MLGQSVSETLALEVDVVRGQWPRCNLSGFVENAAKPDVVILSGARNLPSNERSFAALRMTAGGFQESQFRCQARHGRLRLRAFCRLSMAIFTSALSWKSNIPARIKSAPLRKA